jgi:hypothetical protein
MAYLTSADYMAIPDTSEKLSLSRRILDTVASLRNSKADDFDVNALKDWTPAKLRSFGYSEVELDYLFAKANQSK